MYSMYEIGWKPFISFLFLRNFSSRCQALKKRNRRSEVEDGEKKRQHRNKNPLQWTGIHLHESFKSLEKRIERITRFGSHVSTKR